MIDIKSLLPEVAKLLPGISSQELLEGIQQFAKTHPNFSNQQALQALTKYLQQQKAPRATSSTVPFQNLLSQLGAR
jgi:hypothetical protein